MKMKIDAIWIAVGLLSLIVFVGCPRIRQAPPQKVRPPATVTPRATPPVTPRAPTRLTPARVAGETWQEPHTGIRFPVAIGALRNRSVRRFGGALGIRVRYETKGMGWIDVYVYKGGFATIPSGPSSQPVNYAFKLALKNIRRLAAIGRYQLLVVPMTPPQRLPGEAWMRAGRLTYMTGGVAYESYLFLTGYKNHLIKVRAGFPTSPDRSNAAFQVASLRRFLSGIVTP